MKDFHIIFFYLLIPFFGLFSCTTDSLYGIEDTDIRTSTPALFYLNSPKQETDKNQCPYSTNLVYRDKSIFISESEIKWESKGFAKARTSWTNGDNTVTWNSGDQIGIFMQETSGVSNPNIDRNNVPYTIATENSAASSLIPNSTPIYFPSQASRGINFFAYYPYSEPNESLLINYTLPTDQSTPESIGKADLMNARHLDAAGSNPNIPLYFNHQMVLLSFRISTTLLPATLSKITVSGSNITNKGTLDLSTSTLTPDLSSTFSPFVATQQFIWRYTYAYVDIIINPCSITDNRLSNQLKVTIELKGLLGHSTNLYINGGKDSKTFVGGTRYMYNLTVALSI